MHRTRKGLFENSLLLLLPLSVVFLFTQQVVGKSLRQPREENPIEKPLCDERPGYWENWSGWSSCSRTCGGGVTRRTRRCVPEDQTEAKRKRSTNTDSSSTKCPPVCNGPDVDYQSCSLEKCTDGSDYRAEQCQLLNAMSASPSEWVPYYNHTLNPCHLHCTDLSGNSSQNRYTTWDKVYDGTPCHEDPLAPGVCAGGRCLLTGCDGVIARPGAIRKTYDVCGECGGNGQSCKTVTVHMSVDERASNGDYWLYEIPSRARNIKIVQKILVRPVAVFLGLRRNDRYYVNEVKPSENATLLDVRLEGTRSVLVDSVLVSYTTVRDKHRKGQDVLSARGVISKPLNVTAIVLGERLKIHVSISYALPGHPDESESQTIEKTTLPAFLPIKSNSRALDYVVLPSVPKTKQEVPIERHPVESNSNENESPEWVSLGYGRCSESCGGGIKLETLACKKKEKYVDDIICSIAGLDRPARREKKCRRHPCPPQWSTDDWSYCNKTCGTRNVVCIQRINGQLDEVEPELCLGKAPKARRSCAGRPWCVGTWVVKSCSECSNQCGKGVQNCTVECKGGGPCDPAEKTQQSRECYETSACTAITWYYQSQTTTTTTCGRGSRRSVAKCYGAQNGRPLYPLPDSKCDPTKKLPLKAETWDLGPCPNKTGEWVKGLWGECKPSCYDPGSDVPVRKRPVLCFSGPSPVDPENCEDDQKPPEVEHCAHLPQCPKCTDRESNCDLVRHYNLCSHRVYGPKCCATCNGAN
ncbi:A disintegrin and metalloproteinase with thrombospondin motifs 16-like [Oscarella lobularis]|uniref:A disintegrin and metalloproteinase with thrombospondin motifs 16-like n=1 Tax=Oscarella lobularis TaxID=121494 RepID=UPI003313A160